MFKRFWKCSDEYYDGWELVDYDDSSWSLASVKGLNDGSYKNKDEIFHMDAQWIWTTKESHGAIQTVYCRGAVGKFRSSA